MPTGPVAWPCLLPDTLILLVNAEITIKEHTVPALMRERCLSLFADFNDVGRTLFFCSLCFDLHLRRDFFDPYAGGFGALLAEDRGTDVCAEAAFDTAGFIDFCFHFYHLTNRSFARKRRIIIAEKYRIRTGCGILSVNPCLRWVSVSFPPFSRCDIGNKWFLIILSFSNIGLSLRLYLFITHLGKVGKIASFVKSILSSSLILLSLENNILFKYLST